MPNDSFVVGGASGDLTGQAKAPNLILHQAFLVTLAVAVVPLLFS